MLIIVQKSAVCIYKLHRDAPCLFTITLIIMIGYRINIPVTNYFIVCWKIHIEQHSLNVLLRIVLRFVRYFNDWVAVELMKQLNATLTDTLCNILLLIFYIITRVNYNYFQSLFDKSQVIMRRLLNCLYV